MRPTAAVTLTAFSLLCLHLATAQQQQSKWPSYNETLPRRRKNTRVVIIGAGISGLAAAHELIHKYNFTHVKVYEALDRAGGRIDTREVKRNRRARPHYVQLGAEYVHNIDTRIAGLAKELNVWPSDSTLHTLMTQDFGPILLTINSNGFRPDQKWLTENYNDQFWSMVENAEELGFTESMTETEGQSLFQAVRNWFLKWEKQNTTTTANYQTIRALRQLYVNVWSLLYATDLNYVSQKSYNEHHDPEFVAVPLQGKGFGAIVEKLKDDLPAGTLQLNTAVIRVTHAHPRTAIELELEDTKTRRRERIEADHVIVTMPLGHLKSSHYSRFHPALTKRKQDAIRNLNFGPIGRVFLYFDDVFWPKGHMIALAEYNNAEQNTAQEPINLEDIYFLFTRDLGNRYLMAWVSVAALGIKCFLGAPTYIVGEQAVNRMERASESQLGDAAVRALRPHFGQKVRRPSKVIKSSWKSNQYFRGSYSCYSLASDQSNSTFADLAEPIVKQMQGYGYEKQGVPTSDIPIIQFAGEATSSHYFGTVHGAYDTGIREADRLAEYVCCGEGNTATGLRPGLTLIYCWLIVWALCRNM